MKLISYSLLGSLLCAAGLLARLSWSNLDLIIPETLSRPFVCIIALCLALILATAFVSRRALALVPVVTFLLFSYGLLADLVSEIGLVSIFAVGVLAAMIAMLAYLIRNFEPIKIAQASCAWLLLLTAPFSFPLIGLMFQSSPPQISESFSQLVDDLAPLAGDKHASLPDVIYIVPDRYGSASTLQSEYDLDNASFYEELESRQISYNSNAVANYPTTAHSMSSTQNSGYLDGFANVYGTDTGQLQPLYKAIDNSSAQRAMRNLGYHFVNAGSWWDASRINANADENYGTNPLKELNRVSMSELEHVLWRGTPLREFVGFLMDGAADRECNRIKRKFEWLGNVGNEKKPVFVMAHMTVPHTPIVADRNGNCLKAVIDFPKPGTSWPQFKSAYGEYVRLFNKSILDVFDRQQKARGSSGRQLVFVIQSDEGPYPQKTRLQKKAQSFIDLPKAEMSNKLGIINAIFLDGQPPIAPGELKTPINNWRIILEHLTGITAGRLEHKVIVYPDYQHIHDYKDVTDQYLN